MPAICSSMSVDSVRHWSYFMFWWWDRIAFIVNRKSNWICCINVNNFQKTFFFFFSFEAFHIPHNSFCILFPSFSNFSSHFYPLQTFSNISFSSNRCWYFTSQISQTYVSIIKCLLLDKTFYNSRGQNPVVVVFSVSIFVVFFAVFSGVIFSINLFPIKRS